MIGLFGAFMSDLKKMKNDFSKSDYLINEINESDVLLRRVVLPKLQQDRFFKTQENISICFEGVNQSDSLKTDEDFFKAYQEEGISFINRLEGNYSGFVYDRDLNKIFVFNDHLSNRNIFYFFHPDKGFIFSSKLTQLAEFLREQNISYSLNEDAIYMMALYGFLLDDHTYINEVKLLPYSSLITYDLQTKKLQIEKLFSYSLEKTSLSYKDSLHRLNEVFERAVQKDWQKDAEYKAPHLTFMSGGMDARTNMMIAKELGFENITSLTFGQSNSKDLKYAKEIATGEGLFAFQRFLDNPLYLLDNIIENYIIPCDGLMMFHSSAHASSTIRSFNVDRFQTLHTGIIGDTLFGSFSKENFDIVKNRASIGFTNFVANPSLLDKIQSLPKILEKYQDQSFDLFIFEQRNINASLIGERAMQGTIDSLSPFSNLELIKMGLSIPEKYKANQMLYFDWLSQYHPQILKYKWEKIEMRPNRKYKIILGKNFKKYFNGAKKYFGLKYDSMNPYNQWLKDFPEIIQTFDNILEEEINKTYISDEIRKDLKEIYRKDIFEFRNKFAVVTALLAMKIYFDY